MQEVVSKVEVNVSKVFPNESRQIFYAVQWTEEETMLECIISWYLHSFFLYPEDFHVCVFKPISWDLGLFLLRTCTDKSQVYQQGAFSTVENQTGFIQRGQWGVDMWCCHRWRHLSSGPCAGCIQQYCRAFSALTLRERSQTQHLPALGSRVGSCLLSFP